MLAELPTSAAPPLYIMPPTGLLALAAFAVALLLALLLALLWRLWQRRPRRQPRPATSRQPTAPLPVADLGSAIDELEKRTLRSKTFRDGCHALAVLVKKHLGKITGLGVEEMTSREIRTAFEGGVHGASRVDGARLGRFMTDLSTRRYGRREPRTRDFVKACDTARSLLADDSVGST